ncbi:protein ANTAGONIST OF LIKE HETEROCHROMATIN PROTEIN 1-like isoform X4 [Neodiprion virginianus]|uniref:protein ANTAGONIST OF LIKE HETEROCHROMATIN PROTEIN 1-like isoform X4 n=1 Tax=Neodiprion virginianus TaxID=2961670 RepID=UPI001EE6EC4F|nr:protein ANTAGONIST OF LIKE HETEROCHROMATIN PROTEIN 1-like isoform X4 [Neodiprion virginianus]
MSLTATVGYLVMRRNNAPESSSSSSSDEEWSTILQKYDCEKRKLRPRIIDYDNVVYRYSDDEFKSHFRLSRNTFNYLHDLIREDLVRHVPGCPTISSYHQLMIAIWKMATTDSYRSVCDRFNVGRATAVRAVRRVCHALFRRASRFMQWPTGDGAIEVMRGFERASGFPKTIGAIDGTHIRINAPKQNPVDYINRKGFHSVQLQVILLMKYISTYLLLIEIMDI